MLQKSSPHGNKKPRSQSGVNCTREDKQVSATYWPRLARKRIPIRIDLCTRRSSILMFMYTERSCVSSKTRHKQIHGGKEKDRNVIKVRKERILRQPSNSVRSVGSDVLVAPKFRKFVAHELSLEKGGVPALRGQGTSTAATLGRNEAEERTKPRCAAARAKNLSTDCTHTCSLSCDTSLCCAQRVCVAREREKERETGEQGCGYTALSQKQLWCSSTTRVLGLHQNVRKVQMDFGKSTSLLKTCLWTLTSRRGAVGKAFSHSSNLEVKLSRK